jgi:hypothetical protein
MNFSSKILNRILFLLILISIIILTGIQQKLYEGLSKSARVFLKMKENMEKEKACRDRGYDNCADEERALAMQTNISTFEEEKHANIEQKLHRLQNDDDFYKVDFSKCKPEHEQYNKTAKMYEKEKDNLKRKEERLTNLKIKSNIEKDATTSGRSIRAGILEKRIIEKEVQIEVSREVITKLEVQLLSISTLTENPYCFKLSALNDGVVNDRVVNDRVVNDRVVNDRVVNESSQPPTEPGCYLYSDQECISNKSNVKISPGYYLPGKWTKMGPVRHGPGWTPVYANQSQCLIEKPQHMNSVCNSNDFRGHFNPPATPTEPGCYVYSNQLCSKISWTSSLGKMRPSPSVWHRLNGRYSKDTCDSNKTKYNQECDSTDFKAHFNPEKNGMYR